jgi:transaldolase
VQSVARIYNYFKTQDIDTIVMGASFRNCGQIEALAGCDRLTISPQLLAELAADEGSLTVKLSVASAHSTDAREIMTDESFRWQHNEDAMATEKLAEGIRLFHADELKLEALIRSLNQ